MAAKLTYTWLNFRKKSSAEENNSASEVEEGEIDTEPIGHPMVSLSNIDPKDIPEVSNKFLMRDSRKSDDKEEASKDKDEKEDVGGRKREGRRRDEDKDRDRDRDRKDSKK